MTRWPIVRYLFTNHTPFLLFCLLGLAVIGAVITAVAAALNTITLSVVDLGGQILHWLALGYGFYAATVMSTMIVHGRTRREFTVQHTMFQIGTAALLALPITGLYAAEAAVYRAAGWERGIQDQHVFAAADYPMIFTAYTGMLALAMLTGAFLGVSFLRGDTAPGWSLPVAAVLILAGGGVNGFFSLPFARFGLESVPAVAGASVLLVAVAWAALWLAARDVPLRAKVPA